MKKIRQNDLHGAFVGDTAFSSWIVTLYPEEEYGSLSDALYSFVVNSDFERIVARVCRNSLFLLVKCIRSLRVDSGTS